MKIPEEWPAWPLPWKLMGDTYNVRTLPRRDLHDRIMAEADLSEEKLLIRHLSPGTRVLDIGCGPGSIHRQISHLVNPGGSFTGIDTDAETLRRASDTARLQRQDSIRYLRGNVYALPFREQSFDVVCCRHLLMHLAEPQRALFEAKKVTRQNGYVIAREGDFDTGKYYPRYSAWEMLYDVVRHTLGAPAVGRQLWSLFHAAGFNKVIMRGIPVVATGESFRDHLNNWLEVFEASRDLLVESDVLTGDFLQRALEEGEKLKCEQYGLFSCLEYEIEGRIGAGDEGPQRV